MRASGPLGWARKTGALSTAEADYASVVRSLADTVCARNFLVEAGIPASAPNAKAASDAARGTVGADLRSRAKHLGIK